MRQNSQQPYTRDGLRKTEKMMHWEEIIEEEIIEEEIIWDNRKKGLDSWQDSAAGTYGECTLVSICVNARHSIPISHHHSPQA